MLNLLRISNFLYFCFYIVKSLTKNIIKIMNEEVQMYLDDAKDGMKETINHLDIALQKLRAGKASPSMISGVTVDYYGMVTPISQVANLGTTDAQTIVIQPWEKNMIETIQKAIHKANLGFNPINNGEIIRISVPPLTEERRKALVKQVKQEGETAKIAVRNKRREAIDSLKALLKEGLSEDEEKAAETEVQKYTDKFILEADSVLEKKEKEIMTI